MAVVMLVLLIKVEFFKVKDCAAYMNVEKRKANISIVLKILSGYSSGNVAEKV